MSTENGNNDAYETVLADLLAQRDRIDAAIAAIQAIKGGGGAPASGGGGGSMTKIESDSFFGLTVLEAAKKYLAMMKRPQKGTVITDALKEGGYHFSTDNPLPTVASVLNRDDAKSGEIVKIGRGTYGLASWYKNRPKRIKDDDEEATDPETQKQS